MRETKDINACKKSKNLRIWRIAIIGCCKALKPLETTLLNRVLIEEFQQLVVVVFVTTIPTFCFILTTTDFLMHLLLTFLFWFL